MSTASRRFSRWRSLALLLAAAMGATAASAAPPDPAAMRTLIAKVDLRTLPLPEGTEIGERSAVMGRMTVPLAVEPTMTFFRRELQKAGWKELREGGMPQMTEQYGQAMFAREGCQLSLSLSFDEGKTMVNLLNTGPVDTRRLPRVLQAKPLYENQFTTMLVTEGSVAETVKAVRDELLREGWVQFGTDRPDDPMAEHQSLDFCFGPVEVGAYIGVAPAQGGKTTIQYSTRLLEAALPWPADAQQIEFIDSMQRVRAVSPTKFADVLSFYETELGKQDWQMDEAWKLVGKSAADVVFAQPNGASRLRLQLSQTDDGTRIELDGVSDEQYQQLLASKEPPPEEPAEMPEEAPEEPQVAQASVRAIALPEGAKKVEYDADDTQIRFETGVKPKQALEHFAKKLTDLGWSDEEGVNVSTSVLAVARWTGPNGESAMVTALNPGIGGDTQVTIDVTGMSFDEPADSEMPADTTEVAEDEPAEPTDEPLTAEIDDNGLPFPSNVSSKGSEGSRFRRVAFASTPAPLDKVLAFYREQLTQLGWKEQPGGKVSDDSAQLVFSGKAGKLGVSLKAGDETAIELTTRNQAAAKEAGLLPKPGMAKVIFANASNRAVTATFGGKPVKVGANVGVEKPDGPSFDLKPGKYTLKIEQAGSPPATETIVLGADEAWGVMLGDGGVLPLQMY